MTKRTRKTKTKDERIKRLGTPFNPPFALSSTWNLDRSTNRAIDLAHTQRAIKDFMDVLQPEDKYRVVWRGQGDVPGMTDFDERVIELSYAPLANAPKDKIIPDKLVDVVMGVGIHEKGHGQFREIRVSCGTSILGVDSY